MCDCEKGNEVTLGYLCPLDRYRKTSYSWFKVIGFRLVQDIPGCLYSLPSASEVFVQEEQSQTDSMLWGKGECVSWGKEKYTHSVALVSFSVSAR